MAGVGRLRNEHAQTAALKWMTAAALRLPPTEMLRYLVPAARLLYRLTSSDAPEAQLSAAVRMLATEAVELLQSHAGSQAFLCALNAERARVASVRLARRRDRALQKVLDPAAAAAVKAKKQAAKVRSKARRVDEHRLRAGKAPRRHGMRTSYGGNGNGSGSRGGGGGGKSTGNKRRREG
jgi:uncharacterized membrane protein YgcG